jgi:hypothetical protein
MCWRTPSLWQGFEGTFKAALNDALNGAQLIVPPGRTINSCCAQVCLRRLLNLDLRNLVRMSTFSEVSLRKWQSSGQDAVRPRAGLAQQDHLRDISYAGGRGRDDKLEGARPYADAHRLA